MSGITDEYMQSMLTRSAPYSVVILQRGPAYGSPGADAVIWEHGRRNFELRAGGQLAVVCPIPDDTDVCGVGVFTPPPDEVARLMEQDPRSRPASWSSRCTRAGPSPETVYQGTRPSRRQPRTATGLHLLPARLRSRAAQACAYVARRPSDTRASGVLADQSQVSARFASLVLLA